MLRFIIGLLIGAVTVVFAIQNPESVGYEFLAWSIIAPRSVIVIVVLLAGIVMGWLLSGFGTSRRRRR
jgi:uncharacterized integral membrane protein